MKRLGCICFLSIALGAPAFSAVPLTPPQAMPLVIEKNQGQAPPQVRYLTRYGAANAFFTADGVEFVRPIRSGATRRISWRLDAAAHVEPTGRSQMPSQSNYFSGGDSSKWVTGVENDGEVVYRQVYPGIDLVLHGAGSRLEHDFRIAPGAAPDRIAFHFEGGAPPTLNPQGDLEIHLGQASKDAMILHKPVAYQETATGKVPVDAEFVLTARGKVHFRLGSYDRTRELVIDPVFAFSTYLAGSGGDFPDAVTSDAAGNIYVTGSTYSVNFPLKKAFDPTPPSGGNSAIFVSSFDPTGKTLRFSTYLAAGFEVDGASVAIDPKGNILVAGVAGTAFPHAGNLPAISCGPTGSCYVAASINSLGSKLNYAGEVGEAGSDNGGDFGNDGRVAVDALGNAYVTGVTQSKDFPVTPGTLSPTVPGYPLGSTFVMEIDPTGTVLYSTIIPGLDSDQPGNVYADLFLASGIAVDSKGEVTLVGTAGTGLPTTPDAMEYSFPGDGNAVAATTGFLLKLNPTASAIDYATYLPGTDVLSAFTQDKAGNDWLVGYTDETSLPTTATAYQKSLPADRQIECGSGFVMELDPTGKQVLAATYLLGSTRGSECGTSLSSIALDSKSNVYLGGYASVYFSPLIDPVVSPAEVNGSNEGLLVLEMNSSLSALSFSSFLNPPDQGDSLNTTYLAGLTVGPDENPVIAGSTSATNFPTTTGSFQPRAPNSQLSQALLGFVTKLNLNVPAPSACLDTTTVNFGRVATGSTQSVTANLTNCGNAPLHLKSIASSSTAFTIKDSCSTITAGVSCPITITFKPASNGQPSTGIITVSDDAQIGTQTIQATGDGYSSPYLTSGSDSVDFGNAEVGSPGSYAQVSLSIGYGPPVEILSVQASGNFKITSNTCSGWLQYPGQSCIVGMTFLPDGAGARAGKLLVTSTAASSPLVTLFGTGTTAYKAPLISRIDPPTVQMAGPPQAITVNGWNFYASSVVKINGKPIPTTLLNPQQLTAVVPSSMLTTLGAQSVTVSNPAPGGGNSDIAALTTYRIVPVDAVALAAVPASNTLYAAIPAVARANANTVIPINAATGATGKPIPVGTNPTLLSATSDGLYLYVASSGSQTIQRINLATNTVERTFAYPAAGSCTSCNFTAVLDLQAVPGNSQEVAAAFSSTVALYNDKGLVDFSPKVQLSSSPVGIQSLAFAGNPLTLYGLGWTDYGIETVFSFKLSSSGVTFTPSASTWTTSITGTQIVSDGTLLYTDGGQLLNPVTRKQVGSSPQSIFRPNSNANQFTLFSDPASQSIFAISDQNYITNHYSPGVGDFLWQTGQPISFLAFPGASNSQMNNIIRWGNKGLAFLAQTGDPQYQQVFLLNSSLAAPTVSSPVPVLTSISPPSIAQTSQYPQILLTGSGMLPNTVVEWNGTPLSALGEGFNSTWLSSGAMRVNVPTVSLAQTGSVSINLVNPQPGGGKSATRTLTVTSGTPAAIAISTGSLVFPATNTGGASAAQSVSLTNTGTVTGPALNISLQGANASSFSIQNPNCQNPLNAYDGTCAVQIVFRPATSGHLSATLKITGGTVSTSATVSLTGTGN